MIDSAHDSLRRAAILIATLDVDSADVLLDEIPADAAARVRQMAIELTKVDCDEERAVIGDFLRSSMTSANASASGSQAEGIELCISPESFENATSVASEIDDAAAINFLDGTPSYRLPRLLANERPQTIALVLSRLSESQAWDVLGSLPDRIQADVLRRWAELDETDPKILGEIERELATRIAEHFDASRCRPTDRSRVASVVQSAQPRLKQQILNNLARYDAPLVKHVASQLTFADLIHSSDADLAVVLSVADPHMIVLALADATESFVERTVRLFPVSDAKRLRRAIESLGPTRLTDIEAAQRELARIASMTTRTP